MLKIFRILICVVSVLVETILKSIAFMIFAVLYTIFIVFYPLLKRVDAPMCLENLARYAVKWKGNFIITRIVYDAWS